MIQKEVNEIKKLLKKENCSIDQLYGCYVNSDNGKVMTFNHTFLTLPEEEQFKYLSIFKGILSGKIDSKLLNVEFPTSSEGANTSHNDLVELNKSELNNEVLIEKFFDKIIDNYEYTGNYLILLANNTYDIPGSLDDASDFVYKHVYCAICPVTLSKEGLSYYSDENIIKDRIRDWQVGKPMSGFLFPSFRGRTSDIHEMLYFESKAKNIQTKYLEEYLNAIIPLTKEEQNILFTDVINQSFDNNIDFETMKTINEEINEIIEDHAYDEEPYELSKKDISNAFESAGATPQDMIRFSSAYDDILSNVNIKANNSIDNKKLVIEQPDIIIKASAERSGQIEMKTIDGEKCIIIKVRGDVKFNGNIVS